MIGRAAERLIRRSWGTNADQLAQELYAIFTSELPIEAQSVTITQATDSTEPPIQIRQPIPGLDPLNTPAITITRGNIVTTFGTDPANGGPVFGNTTFGGTTIGGTTFVNNGGDSPPPPSPPATTGGGGGGGTDLGGIDFPGQDPKDRTVAVPAPSDNPIALHGVVGSKLNGQTYSVTCYAKSPQTGRPIGVLRVRQAQIDSDDTIPPGTGVMVLAFPGKDGDTRTILDAIMYVPVFLEDKT